MRDLFRLIGWTVVDLFRSRAALEAEIWTLRQQINGLRRRLRPLGIRWSLSVVSKDLRCAGDREARHYCSLASRGFSVVLVLEVETPWWPAHGAARNTKVDLRDEHRKVALGSSTDPWRVAQARYRNRADQRDQVYGWAYRAAVPRLVDCGAWSTADFMVWRHSASDCRIDRKSGHGSLRLGTGSPLSHS
jgi:hypothetical protein